MTRPLTAKAARALINAAELVKAPTWPDSRTWHVTSGGQTLIIVEPSYGGTSRTGRNGWNWRLAGGTPTQRRPEPTREKAAAQGLAAWQRWVTAPGRP
ncbi:hypothetical protein [Streptomyces sp. NPDC005780]|uniref:hypothetical protein n=1 Tax=Streptomyces sp. NPDC005780 TaxID=3364730 RepID=UPI00369F47A1